MAVASLLVGIVLALKEQPSVNKSLSRENTLILDEQLGTYEDEIELAGTSANKSGHPSGFIGYITDLVTVSSLSVDNKNILEDQTATSYTDELRDQDDEVEEPIDTAEATLAEDQLPEDAEKLLQDILDVADQALRIQHQFSYTVARGDKLKDVLDQSGLSAAVAQRLIKQYPALAQLKSGQQFYWVLDNDGELEYMNWLVSEKEERVYERRENGTFAFQKFEKKGVWKLDVVRGTIKGSFAASLKAVNLSDRQINQLAVGLQSQIATNKLKRGDKFAILVKREYVDGKVTELGNVEGIHVISNKKSYYAIQADNGRYYSRHGETLSGGFARHPLLYAARITSSFNPQRRHPITGRISPHKGVDYGVPIGTPIIAPSDGVVEHVAYQARGAGRYIRLKHGHITTVYMHLSKSLVKPGQRVKKGERIALSGNTGGSTGPHLHYEFHINGRPVNPITVKLPGSNSGMSNKERQAFLKKAKSVEARLKM
ncbi:murein DD-endopeptidase MepM [Mannheimia sp. AT1]|uniref:Murein DD-endopeptidase MepM n=1 Tax=Mannheimia cairinae TaxID=3025936 RepID=A0ABT5ML02_9PAST|nr:murein DD-endopeptidase MepM [Mannheimia cairinae]MDD0822869.1 murein DD-endopeptidase MepM [Mannheimia cairinae]MDD0826103.1 murein DD-endopeptidase MepM [Mannheimia cairinae]